MTRSLQVMICSVALAGFALPLTAGTGATFSLGLGAQYFGDRQGVEGADRQRNTLATALLIAVKGQLIDQRFLTFESTLEPALTKVDATDDSGTDGKELWFDFRIRGFNSRALSFQLNAGRRDSDFSRQGQGVLISGTSEWREATLALNHKSLPVTRLTYRKNSFASKDSSRSLRDEDQTSLELTSRASIGKLAGNLELRRRDFSLFGNLLRRQADNGVLLLDFNRTGRNYLFSRTTINRFRTARQGGDFNAPAEVLTFKNFYRRRLRKTGRLDITADFQESNFGQDSVSSSRLGSSVLYPLSPTLLLEGELAYLESDLSSNDKITQPTAILGVRWERTYRRWEVLLNPKFAYIEISTDNRPAESSVGGSLTVMFRRDLARGSVGLDGEYLGNQLSIAPVGPDDPFAGRSFLTGLEKSRLRVRLRADYSPSRRFNISGYLEALQRERLHANAAVSQNIIRGQLQVQWRNFQLDGLVSQTDQTRGEFPTRIDQTRLRLAWSPKRWLTLDALAQTEDRQAFDVIGSFDFVEAGVNFNYGELSFFARIREEQFADPNLASRTNQRYWGGVLRTIRFHLGEPR